MIPWLLLVGGVLGVPVDRVAAVVNEDLITWSELYDVGGDFIEEHSSDSASRRAAELEVLDSLLLRKLVSQELTRLSMGITEEDLDRAIADVASGNELTLDVLRVEVERTGITWDQYEEEFRESMRQMRFNQAILQPRITVDEDALLDMYQRLGADGPEEVDLGAIYLAVDELRSAASVAEDQGISEAEAHVQLNALADAQAEGRERKESEIRNALASGVTFPEVAQRYDEASFGSTGGRMGILPDGQLRPDLNAAAFATEVGSLSPKVCDDTGCFYLYVFQRGPQKPPPLEDVRDNLLNNYFAERFEQETALWFEQASRRASIDIKLVP